MSSLTGASPPASSALPDEILLAAYITVKCYRLLVFEKGTAVIEKSCGKEEKEKQFQIDSYAAEIKGDRRSLRAFSRKAGGASTIIK